MNHSPDFRNSTYVADYALLLREGDSVTVEHDRHVFGLFPRATWLGLLHEAGLDVQSVSHTFSDGTATEMFVGTKR